MSQLPKITFVSKQERERLRAEKERAELEAQKRIQDSNKQERREMLKAATKMTTSRSDSRDSFGTVEALVAQAAASVQNGLTASKAASSVRRNRANFDWAEAEDTMESIDVSSGPVTGQRRDPLLLESKGTVESSNVALVHWSQKLTNEMTERDWRIFREDQEITVTGARGRAIQNPFRSWTESGLPRDLLEAVYKAGYTRPTAIQMQSIPIAIKGHDIVGLSSTGSGKTAAFILPMLTYIKRLPPITPDTSAMDGPYALVLAPSRELALQIESEAKKFSSFCNIKSCSIVGGKSAEQQTLTLSQGVELIVATPGRLADSLDAKQTVLNQCFYVVLDEADKMIDLGFESYVNRILDSIPASNLKPIEDTEMSPSQEQYRITQMFSATMPPSVEKLTKRYLRNPITISVGSAARGGGGKPEIEQRIEFVNSEMEKKKLLLDIMNETEFPVMIFVNSKRQADFVGTVLNNTGIITTVLHSGKLQDRREDAINQFKAGRADVLVCTDVAGRGIDIPNVQHVVCFDMAKSIEDYTHRIGRTARGVNTKGIATSFILAKEDDAIMPSLKTFLQQSKQYVPEQLQDSSDFKRQRKGDDFFL